MSGLGGIFGGGSGGGGFPLLGGVLGGDQSETGTQAPKIPENKPTAATEGAGMWFFLGNRVRVPGTIVYQSKIDVIKDSESVGSGKSASKVTSFRFETDVVVAYGEHVYNLATPSGPQQVNEILRIWANGKIFWKAAKPKKNDHRYDTLQLRKGGRSGSPTSLMEDFKNAGTVPAFHDQVMQYVSSLDLEDFGNLPVQRWEALLEPDAKPYTVADAIRAIAKRCEVEGGTIDADAMFDVSEVAGTNAVESGQYTGAGSDGQVDGALWQAPVSPLTMLDHLLVAYDLSVREDSGVLRFFDRGDERIITIEARHVGAYTGDAPDSRPIRFREEKDHALPTVVVVQHYDEKYKWQRASQERRVNAGRTENVVTLDLPLVMHRSTARRIATRRLWGSRLERAYAEAFHLPPEYIHVQEGDVVAFPFEGQTYYIRVLRKTMGNDFAFECEGPVLLVRKAADAILTTLDGILLWDPQDDDVNAEDDPNSDDDDDPDDEEGYVPPEIAKEPIETPPLTEEHATTLGVWWPHCGRDPLAEWRGSQVFRSHAEDAKYTKIDLDFSAEQVVGATLTALGTVNPALPNHARTVDVQMFEGVPGVVPYAEAIDGDEEFEYAIGDEIVIPFTRTTLPETVVDLSAVTLSIATNGVCTRSGSAPDFTASLVVGRWVRVEGAIENEPLFRKITARTANTFTLDVTDGNLIAETGLADCALRMDANCYRLTGFLSGRRGTEDAVGTHAAGEPIILLKTSAMNLIPFKQDNIGKTRYWKDVPTGLTKDDVDPIAYTFTGKSMQPFAPADFAGVRIASEDAGPDQQGAAVRFTWTHRSRVPWLVDAESDPPQLEPKERYVLKLFDDDDDPTHTTPLRTVDIEVNPSQQDMRVWEYTAKKQDKDSAKTPGTWAVGAEIYQYSYTLPDHAGKVATVSVA